MEQVDYKEAAQFIRDDIRLKTFPIGVKFLKDTAGFPEKTRRPSVVLSKRITICQGVTMARNYGWTVGLAREDLICVPAMIAFGFSGAARPEETLGKLFCEVSFSESENQGIEEASALSRLENEEYRAVVLSPLQKGLYDPDTVVIYGNPAQVMRMIQALVFKESGRIQGNFGGKVECTEYLVAPFQTGAPRVVIPGMGDRIFSMTQDDEMVFAMPGSQLKALVDGMKDSGKKIGARYPVTSYQNFEPDFPKPYKILGEELGLF